MCLTHFSAIHGPLPIMRLQPRFLTHPVSSLIIPLKHDSTDATFFHQSKVFLIVRISLFLINAHPYPVLYLTGSNGFTSKPTVMVYHITYFFFRHAHRHTECTLCSLYQDFSTSRQVLQFRLGQEEIIFGTNVVFLLGIIIQLCIEHGPKQLIGSHIVRILEGISTRSYHLIRKIQESPSVRHVHIDASGRHPYPVFFTLSGLQPLHT